MSGADPDHGQSLDVRAAGLRRTRMNDAHTEHKAGIDKGRR